VGCYKRHHEKYNIFVKHECYADFVSPTLAWRIEKQFTNPEPKLLTQALKEIVQRHLHSTVDPHRNTAMAVTLQILVRFTLQINSISRTGTLPFRLLALRRENKPPDGLIEVYHCQKSGP
jgi:hypothetical protein